MKYQTNTHAACVTAMYMAMGAERVMAGLPKCNYELRTEHRGGNIGFYGDLANLALYSEELLVEMGVEDFPGVLDYEISEPFGAWFAENDPDDDTAKDELKRRIEDWFSYQNGDII